MSTSATFHLPAAAVPTPAPPAAREAVSDVRLFHTPDGGDVELVNGLFTMADGLETAVYLSLFGGNEQDSGLRGDDPKQWWGNLTETEPTRRYRSETQHLVQALPAIPANLRRLEDAALRDLGWLEDEVASSLRASASIPGRNRVTLNVAVELRSGTKHNFQFATDWGRAAGV